MLLFKFDVMEKLKERGYTTYYLRNKTTLGSRTMQEIKSGKVPGTKSIDVLCGLLECQPGDLLEYRPDE